MYLHHSRGSSKSLNICMRLGERAPLFLPLPLFLRVMTAPGPVVLFNNFRAHDYSSLQKMIPPACNLALTFTSVGGEPVERQGQGSDTPCKLATGDTERKQ